MSDLQAVIDAIDHLSPQELLQVRNYVEERAKTLVYTLSSEQLRAIDEALRPVQAEAAQMSEAEIHATLDEAIAEVRRA